MIVLNIGAFVVCLLVSFVAGFLVGKKGKK